MLNRRQEPQRFEWKHVSLSQRRGDAVNQAGQVCVVVFSSPVVELSFSVAGRLSIRGDKFKRCFSVCVGCLQQPVPMCYRGSRSGDAVT